MLPAQLFAKVLERLPRPDEGCWLWPGSVGSQGYGKITLWGVGTYYVHRIMYGYEHGSVPPELDHLCRVRLCARPSHLEPVTHGQNIARGLGAKQELCRAGHRYADVGWYSEKRGRKCKACHRATAMRSYYAKRDRAGIPSGEGQATRMG